MADSTFVRSNARAYASEQFLPGFVSQQYTRSPLLGFLYATSPGKKTKLRMSTKGLINAPGALIGGRNMTQAQRASIMGSERVNIPGVQTGTTGDTKNMTARDTAPSVTNPTTNSQDQKRKMGFVQWSHKKTPIIVWHSTQGISRGKFRIQNITDDAVSIAVEDQFDHLIDEMWKGSPTDQDADTYWDEQAGINDVCDTTNVLYGLERNGTTFFDGKRVTGAKTANLALIDDANVTQGIQDTGHGVGLVLFPKALYLTVKAEALTKGGTLIHQNTPESAETGIITESIRYGDILITYDPGLKDYSAVTGDPDMSDNVFMGDMGDWVFQTNTGMNFEISPFRDLTEYSEGAIDADQAFVDLEYRWFDIKPWTSILYTAVT